jgi:hypothetical protein
VSVSGPGDLLIAVYVSVCCVYFFLSVFVWGKPLETKSRP